MITLTKPAISTANILIDYQNMLSGTTNWCYQLLTFSNGLPIGGYSNCYDWATDFNTFMTDIVSQLNYIFGTPIVDTYSYNIGTDSFYWNTVWNYNQIPTPEVAIVLTNVTLLPLTVPIFYK